MSSSKSPQSLSTATSSSSLPLDTSDLLRDRAGSTDGADFLSYLLLNSENIPDSVFAPQDFEPNVVTGRNGAPGNPNPPQQQPSQPRMPVQPPSLQMPSQHMMHPGQMGGMPSPHMMMQQQQQQA